MAMALWGFKYFSQLISHFTGQPDFARHIYPAIEIRTREQGDKGNFLTKQSAFLPTLPTLTSTFEY
jgi:hypothetical protein